MKVNKKKNYLFDFLIKKDKTIVFTLFYPEAEEKELDEKVEPPSSEEKSSDQPSFELDMTEVPEKTSQEDSTRLKVSYFNPLTIFPCLIFL